MRVPARLELHRHLDLADVQAAAGAGVLDVEDVAAGRREHGEQPGEVARAVLDRDAQRQEAAGGDQPVAHDLGAAAAGRRCRRRPRRRPAARTRAGSSMTAATAAAPAGSTTSLARSRQCSSARDSASSSTVTTSSTRSRTSGNVTSPGRPTAMPSAIVAHGGRAATGRPARERRRGTPRRPRPARRRRGRPAAAP